MSYYGNKFSTQEHEILKRAAEARKQGKVLPEYDEKGQLINPYIPMYIAKAPWYIKRAGDEKSLEHQKIAEKRTDSSAQRVRGLVFDDAEKKYRKGACENCGAMTHKSRDCLERPRKRGAKWTGREIRPDEFIQEVELDFEGKRDRWAGYDAEEYEQVIRDWEEDEQKRVSAKAAEIGRKRLGRNVSDNEGSNDEDSDGASDGEDGEGDEEKYAETVDMPGQKIDLKTRMTIRNLRLREDTAKYLEDLNSTAAQYDPKTRSMRRLAQDSGNSVFVSEEDREKGGEKAFAWEPRKDNKTVVFETDSLDCTTLVENGEYKDKM